MLNPSKIPGIPGCCPSHDQANFTLRHIRGVRLRVESPESDTHGRRRRPYMGAQSSQSSFRSLKLRISLRRLFRNRTAASRYPSPKILLAMALATFGGILCAIASAQTQTYQCTTGFGPVAVAPVLPATLMQSLKTIANPVVPN